MLHVCSDVSVPRGISRPRTVFRLGRLPVSRQRATANMLVEYSNRTPEQRTLNLQAHRSSCRGSRPQPNDYYLRLGPGSASSADVADGTPPILHAGFAPVGLAWHLARSSTTRSITSDFAAWRPGMSPAQVHGGYMTGPLPVHGRHIDLACWIQSLTGDMGNLCGTMPPLSQRGCVGLPSQRQRGALGQRLNSSLDGMMRADPAARPGRKHEQAQPAAQREQDGEEPNRPGCPAH